VDNRSEFQADFEAACRDRGIHLSLTPSPSPKPNSFAERAHRTYKEKFCALDGGWSVGAVTPALLAHERAYNTRRPHQLLAVALHRRIFSRATQSPRGVS